MNDKLDPISSPASVSSDLNERLAGESDSTSRASMQPAPSVATEAATEIALDHLRGADQLVIRTLNNTYTFLVDDPVKRNGLLSGGVIGNDPVQAVLDSAPAMRGHRLRAGERACFYVTSGGGLKRMTTSVITHLIHRRAGRSDS